MKTGRYYCDTILVRLYAHFVVKPSGPILSGSIAASIARIAVRL
jgi:hypothetical protein